MHRSDFNYSLPEELIAQEPLPRRTQSRLLVMHPGSGSLEDRIFADLISYLRPGDLVVFNDTRVIPARLTGCKASGGRVEILIERITADCVALAHVRASRAPRPATSIQLADGCTARVRRRAGSLFELAFDRDVAAVLQAHGRVPLPPYIERAPTADDVQRYQTVYARNPGAVAAPTAGLHFDEALLRGLGERGVERGFVTLHVGAGTFVPVRSERVEDHRMHAEWLSVGSALCDQVRSAKARGGHVYAVGTTTVRALETAAQNGVLGPYEGETELFIYPGFQFNVVDGMVTNFHLPESSLLMLVAAFAGRDPTLAAYRHAVAEGYRFFSYGDAMLILADGPH